MWPGVARPICGEAPDRTTRCEPADGFRDGFGSIRRIPLNKHRFQIGLLAVAALVALRLALGCHFLYEGLWKTQPENHFTAAPFLTLAKGPVAPLFYAMIPDIDAREKLGVGGPVAKAEAGEAKKSAGPNPEAIVNRWNTMRQEFVEFYKSADSKGELSKAAEQTFKQFSGQLTDYFVDHTKEIQAHFASLDRFRDPAVNKEIGQNAPFQKQRNWDRMMELRQESAKWVKDIDAQETAYLNSLTSLLNDEQKKLGRPAASWNPFTWDQMELLNFTVTYSLLAIGLCLMLGFCTPLAALGGAAFMCFVVMTQPAFPTIYPHDPPVVGHALLINKDFIEMLALLVVAATGAGRWGGLDFFLCRMLRRCCPFCRANSDCITNPKDHERFHKV